MNLGQAIQYTERKLNWLTQRTHPHSERCIESKGYFTKVLTFSEKTKQSYLYLFLSVIEEHKSGKYCLTFHKTHFITLLQGLEIVSIALAASIFKEFTATRVNVKVEPVLHCLAWPFVFLQGA